jgi:hypothetical protein
MTQDRQQGRSAVRNQGYMGLFRSQAEEDMFVKRFGQLVYELGVENVTVHLPEHWAPDFAQYRGTVRLQFTAVNRIKILAKCDFVTVEESMPLFEIGPVESSAPSEVAIEHGESGGLRGLINRAWLLINSRFTRTTATV